MGTARHWNGTDDVLYIFPSFTSYTAFTWVAWVKRDSITPTRNGLAGRVISAANGWAIYITEGNLLTFQHDATLDQIASPDLSNWTLLAITHVGSGGSGTTKFYSGTNSTNITLLSTLTPGAGGFSELAGSGTAISLGHITGFSALSTVAWNGSLDQIGIWTVELTLAEIKAASACGQNVRPGFQKLVADITGSSPEPCIFDNVANTLTVSGTTVLTGVAVGCDASNLPAAPLMVCALVNYPQGLALSGGRAPTVAIYALVDPADESDPGILMRIERCQGASCVGFGFRGNSAGLQFVGSGAPQAEYLDSAVYGTIYRYRVRMENSYGFSAWSATIQIDTTVNGTSVCDTGVITDLTEELKIPAGLAAVEYTMDRIQLPAGMGFVEYTLDRLQVQAGIGIVEYYDDGGAPPPQPQILAGIAIVEYYDNVADPPAVTDPNDPGPIDANCLCP